VSNKYLEKIAMNAGVRKMISGIPTAGKVGADELKNRAKSMLRRDVSKHIPTGGLDTMESKVPALAKR